MWSGGPIILYHYFLLISDPLSSIGSKLIVSFSIKAKSNLIQSSASSTTSNKIKTFQSVRYKALKRIKTLQFKERKRNAFHSPSDNVFFHGI